MINHRNRWLAVCSLGALAVNGHMQMSWPYPLRSEFNPANNYSVIDYSMTDPLNPDGSNFPCKGYQNDRSIQPVVTYEAGSTYNMTLTGSAMHGGGSCQLSLSYDNGATFSVIQSMIGGCPLKTTYDFTIPSYAPAGTALFAWTWQNLIGNREYYMNCAEVQITSSRRKHRQRQQDFSRFDQLPYIWKANLEGLNTCTTEENVNVVYPQPGPRALYGGGMHSAHPETPGDCDAPTPFGQTYEDLGDTPAPPASLSSSSTKPSHQNVHPSRTSSRFSKATTRRRQIHAYAEQQSTTTITLGCETTEPPQSMPPYYITAAACTGTSASCPCASGYACSELRPCIWGCEASKTHYTTATSPYPVKHSLSTTQQITTHTVTPVPTQPAYVGSTDVNRYLPCVPGSFICLNRYTWDTCDYNVQAQWVYEYPRSVAAGMECLPSLSPYAAGSSSGQQGLTPKGYYRNDQIVRAFS